MERLMKRYTDEETMINDYLAERGVTATKLDHMSFSQGTSIWHGVSSSGSSVWVISDDLLIDHMIDDNIGTFSEASEAFSSYWERIASFLKAGNLIPCVNFEIPSNNVKKTEFTEKLFGLAAYIKSYCTPATALAS